jgi:hypothetical protein
MIGYKILACPFEREIEMNHSKTPHLPDAFDILG